MPRAKTALAVGLAALALSACAVAPTYAPPKVETPVAFKETGPWTPAAPADGQPRGAWWSAYGDPVLDDLEARAEKANATLAAAVAAHDQASALAAQARAAFLPEITGAGTGARYHRSDNTPLRVGGPDD